MELDVDLSQQTTADNLPDKAEDKMFTDLNDVAGTNVDDRASDSLGGLDDDIVVLAHLESIEVLGLLTRQVEDSLIDSVWDAVVDELGKDQPILAVVKHLERIGGEGEARAKIWVASENGVDVAGELGALILVDGVGDVGIRALDLDPATHASLGCVAASALGDNTATGRLRRAGRQALLGRRGIAKLGDELRGLASADDDKGGLAITVYSRPRSPRAPRAARSQARLPSGPDGQHRTAATRSAGWP